MTAKEAAFIALCWLIVAAAFAVIYLTGRGVLCSIAMIVLTIAVTAAVAATVLSDGNRDLHAE
jgi:hypothetical protein